MKNVSKSLIIIFVLAVFSLLFSGCDLTSSPLTFEDIEIVGEDVENIEEGNYSLRYTIENLEKYQRTNDVEVVVSVTDKHNQSVNLMNNRIIYVEKNNTYLVSILITSGNKYKSHDYTVTAIKTLVTVTFTSGEFENFEDFTQELYYGEDLEQLPELAEYTPAEGEVINSYWTAENPEELTSRLPSQLLLSDMTNIRQDVTVYAYYEIEEPSIYILDFDTRGGEQIDSIEAVGGAGIEAPADPIREDYVFFGWYKDNEYTERYFFPTNPTMPLKNTTLYARWITQIDNPTDKSYFDYQEINELGWLNIKAKDPENMPEDVVIPRFIEGKPVVEIAASGFLQCVQIKTVLIPYTIQQINTSAFSGRTSAPISIVDMSLESVQFENTDELVQIQNYAFSHNNSLLSINIPDSVQTLGTNVLEGCSNLQTVTFGADSNLTQILEKAFMGCESLVSIDLPQSLISIEEQAFFNCTSLSQVTLNNESNVVSLSDGTDEFVFGYEDTQDNNIKRLNITINVPNEILEQYHAAATYDHTEFTLAAISAD